MNIVIYPTGTNPYQNLLYSELLTHENIQLTYLNGKFITKYPVLLGVPTFHIRLIMYRFLIKTKNKNIFHLHWVAFSLPSRNRFIQVLSFLNTLSSLYLIKLLGFKLIWTVHNILPHEPETFNDNYIVKRLSRLCDAKIVHSKSTLDLMKSLDMDSSKTYINPIGTYKSVYKNIVSKNDARKHLSISNNSFVYLFFGEIKPYKGIKNLIRSFKKIVEKHSSTTLIVVGRCWNNALRNDLEELKKEFSKNVILHIKYIKDEEVQYYFNASDITVLPFESITTSSSTILSFSFGRPIITSDLPANYILPESIAFKYSLEDSNGLFTQMEKAFFDRASLDNMSKASEAYAATLSWKKIADETYKIYKNV